MDERRSGTDRRSNWSDALRRLHQQDAFLRELDHLLVRLLEQTDADTMCAVAYEVQALVERYRQATPAKNL